MADYRAAQPAVDRTDRPDTRSVRTDYHDPAGVPCWICQIRAGLDSRAREAVR